ncbi:MAG: hypothetical protein Q9181_004369 [Wetmoreana brouardii]
MFLHWVPPPSRFALPDYNRPSSLSPSRSPHKRQGSTTDFHDPLLSQLSPSSALEALQDSNTLASSSQHAVYESIVAASSSERALAIRAASAGKQLKEWHRALQDWQWSTSHNGFEPPARHNSPLDYREAAKYVQNAELPSCDRKNDHQIAQELWGSLPAQTVVEYENRVEEIRDAMAALELDDLKLYVREAHLSSTSSRQSSITSSNYSNTSTGYNHMDDFTAIVTTTIMQALPVIFRLEALLGAWEARLAVLRAVPGFTNTMGQAQKEMSAAWRMLDSAVDDGMSCEQISMPLVYQLKTRLESQIRDLGQRLDYMLDLLEGRQDNIPDQWIDDLEQLEAEFCNWAVEAEKIAIDWRLRSRVDDVGALGGLGSAPEPLPDHLPEPGDLQEADRMQKSGNLLEAGDLVEARKSPEANKSPVSKDPPGPGGMMDGPSDDSTRLSHRPSPLNLQQQHRRDHSNATSDFSSEASYPGSATSDYFSNMSSPEIHDASKTEYFGVGSPVEVITPGFPGSETRISQDTILRQSSQRTERGDHPLPTVATPSRSRASTVIPEPTIDEDDNQPGVALDEKREFTNHGPSTPPIPTKSRHRFEEVTDLSPGNTPVKILRRKTADNAPSPGRLPSLSPVKASGEQLEARINSILTELPVDIRLARDDGTEIAQSPSNSGAIPSKKSKMPRLMRAQTTAPSMTLTPSRQKAGESDVKLYHLHQSGQGPSIKLFVRLVGENGERVMVRIGGGWADLAEYLKEYAIHHGRRTVSSGQFDIQGFPHSQSNSPATSLGSLHTPRSRPDSPIAMISSDHSNDIRPSSQDSKISRRSWADDGSPSLGLSGPKSRKATVSPNKQAWVDNMVEKARSGSGENKKVGTREAFGGLGIVGGTKRLFMKGRRES